MSNFVFKSSKLKTLNFKYSQDSVVRFIGKGNVPFFDCHNVTQQTLLKLINFVISESDEPFHVSYYTYKAGIPLYIGPDKLSSKPYWFNQSDYQESIRSTSKTNYLLMSITDEFIEQIDIASETMQIPKGHLITLIFLTEFSPNPWSKDQSIPCENLINCALNLQENSYSKPRIEYTHTPKKLDWPEIAVGLKEICGADACSLNSINSFIVKAKHAFSEHRLNLKQTKKLDKMKYTVTALDVNGNVLRIDKLSVHFALRNLDQLFVQNLEYYKHTHVLHVHDPFDENTFIYYPTLTTLFEGKQRSINFSIPASIFYWMTTVSGASLRTRTSMFKQAGYSFTQNWKKDWDAVPDSDKETVIEAVKKLKVISKQGGQQTSPEDNPEVKKARGRPKGSAKQKLDNGDGQNPLQMNKTVTDKSGNVS